MNSISRRYLHTDNSKKIRPSDIKVSGGKSREKIQAAGVIAAAIEDKPGLIKPSDIFISEKEIVIKKRKPKKPGTDGKIEITISVDAQTYKNMKASGKRWDIQASKALKQHFSSVPATIKAPADGSTDL